MLIAMFVFLCYRVYQVMYPPLPEAPPPLASPREQIAANDTSIGLPGDPPPRPRLDPPGGGYTGIHRRNPFWYYSGRAGSEDGGAVTAETLNIRLRDIKEDGQQWRARITTGSLTEWYDEGAQFEGFRLESIDPDSKTAVVYAVQQEARVTLQIQR